MSSGNKVWIASHRGRFGGDIAENTLPAFEAALRCGADIVEMDVRKTKDNVMILFHDESPQRLLGLPGKVSDYTLSQLRERRLINVIGNPSGSVVTTLDEALHALKGRCMINLDQCWGFMDEVYAKVEALGMEEQALIKGRAPYGEVVSWIKSRQWRPKFIPVITREEELAQFDALPEELHFSIVEVFLTGEQDKLIAPDFVQKLHARGLRLWVNALSLGQGINLSAGHDDSLSVSVSPDLGWGWLIQRGVNIIQTDWPAELRRYLDNIGL